jgi:SAM-dependent methyltransferase
LEQHPADDQWVSPDAVRRVPGEDLSRAPDRWVEPGDRTDLADTGAVRGQEQRDEPPGQRVVEVTGRAWAQELGYPEPELARVPNAAVESFAGVANHWTLGRVEPRSVVLDLGCGAGTDLLIAAQMTGPAGRVIGVDMTPAMLDRARQSAREMGLANVALHESLIESLPLADGSVDIVISNGVIDLAPDKDAVFDEIDRVLRPGGRLQIADVVIHTEVSEDARKRIDLWTG